MGRPSKKEARIARQEAKSIAAVAKSARLVDRPIPRTVRREADPASIFQMQMTWSCVASDLEGEWSSGTPRQWNDEAWRENIHPKLCEWAKWTWASIDVPTSDTGHKMHHNMDVDDLWKEAQSRLAFLEIYEDTIFRFRLGNKPRIWGFRRVAEFEILWFDPLHEIYPTDPS
jgi:hypothetical protein